MQNGKIMHSFGIIGLIYAFFTVLGEWSGPRPQQNLLQLFENTNAASEMDVQTIYESTGTMSIPDHRC